MNALRVIAWMEGVSFLLFGVSMPLKYGFDIPEPNYVLAMVHGILFVIYNHKYLRTILIFIKEFSLWWQLQV